MGTCKHIVIVAGEESGDLHAANLVKQLQATHSDIRFSGIGGHHLRDCGVPLISDLARFGITGLSGVIQYAGVIRRAFRDIKAHLQANKPDLLILVDYPGFNLRLANYAKTVLGITILYYIGPQIWAWKAKRIHTIKACVDHMAVILPFEKKIYLEAGVPVSFVGHPLVETMGVEYDPQALRLALNLPANKKLVAMLPGSRRHEIEKHMPILVESALRLSQQYDDIHVVIPVATTIAQEVIRDYFSKKPTISYSLITGQAQAVMACSDCVVVASGTASLESALLEKPMCIIYKGSLLSYIIAFHLIQVKFLGLCNLLQNQMIAPELLQYDCNPTELTRMIDELLHDNTIRHRMQKRLAALKHTLSASQADCSIAKLVEKCIGLA